MSSRPFGKTLVLAVSLCACALLAAFALSRSVARADDGEVGAEGGSVYPIWTTDIRMAAETVQATCFGSFAEYRVDFKFVNYGKARKVELGFPFTNTVSGGRGTEAPVGFQAWQNGRPLSVQAVEAGAKGNTQKFGYFLHAAVFPHGVCMITVSYLANPSGSGGQRRRVAGSDSSTSGMANYYQYWLHTGSTWKGTIGKAVVRYGLADTFRGTDIGLTAADAYKYVPVTAPANWTKPLPRTYEWQFNDFEPKPAHLSAADWWKPLSRYDVTLGFAMDWYRRGPTAGTWTVSSSAAGGSFGKRALRDGVPSTCWAEGAPGPGIGQWIEKRFKRSTRLRELRILPGNNAYGTAFTKFARPRTLRAVFSDGSSTLLHLKDARTLQRFPVDVTTRSVRLVIRSVYRGSDYPGTCISEVEFGTERAPGYVPFRKLISDPYATGRLTAWAGPPAPQPHYASGTSGYIENFDSTNYAGGDLMEIDAGGWFGRYAPPFAQPCSLAAIRAKDPRLQLPKPDMVGEPTSVSALSYRTFAIRYSSGVDLLVYLQPSRGPKAPLLTELAREAGTIGKFTDSRRHAFKLVMEGSQVVVLARAGCSDYTGSFPSQVFWRAGNTSYHLYARSKAVTTHRLLVVARSMVDPGFVSGARRPVASRPLPWLPWLLLGVAVAAAAAMALLLGLQRRRLAMPQPSLGRGPVASKGK